MNQTPSPASRTSRAGAPTGGGRLVAMLGPTNTGKTHFAVERMLGHDSGMIGLPLRLLAREIYDRVVALRGADAAALITGEEKIVPDSARYFICTVESMPLTREVSFLAVDEIQLCADPERGHIFTDRLLHARGQGETMFLGAETMRAAIRQLLPETEFITRTRFSELTHIGAKKLSRLPRRSAIVAFSAEAVYGLAELVRRQRGGAAVVLGALSPRTRNAQVALYQSGDVDYLVATDAIGMGLNMDVDHVAFASLRKYDGHAMRALRAHEIAQIAGRAGRHMNDGTFGTTGDVNAIDAEIVEQVESHRFEPVRVLQWRSRDLDFSTIGTLIEGLEAQPPEKGLARARAASDLEALRLLAEDARLRDSVTDAAGVERLWSVCQIPDFRNVSIDEHVRLLAAIHQHLTDNGGTLPADWVAGHIDRLDNVTGDIDTLSSRIAHIRTWTFVANRAGWLADAAEWQERARAVEDRLSDALHEGLTQRFIDRRTSVLMKRLRQNDDLISAVTADGEVTVEEEYVGKLTGFLFQPDPRASGVDGKALRAAATKALRAMINARAEHLANARDHEIELSDHGRLWWEGAAMARLEAGRDGLSPRVSVIADDLLEPTARERVEARLQAWVDGHIARTLGPLLSLRAALEEKAVKPAAEDEAVVEVAAAASPATEETSAPDPSAAETPPPPAPTPQPAPTPAAAAATPLSGQARGIAFSLVEAFGVLDRRRIADQIRALDQDGRGALRRHGVRFGEFSVFMPALLKPAQARLAVILWAVREGLFSGNTDAAAPTPPAPGLTSAPVEPGQAEGVYAAAGFRVLGGRAVRADMLERVANLIREQRSPADRPAAAIDATPKIEVVRVKHAAAAAPAAPPATPETGEAQAAPQAPTDTTGETPPEAPVTETTVPETMAETSAPASDTAPAEPSVPAQPAMPRGSFTVTPDMLSLLGCSAEEFAGVLNALGFRKAHHRPEGAGEAIEIWQPRGRTGAKGPRRGTTRRDGARKGKGEERVAEAGKGEGRKGKPREDSRQQRSGKAAAKPGARPDDRAKDRPKGPRKGQQDRKQRDRREGDGEYRTVYRTEQRPGRNKGAVDPDSPFAALAALKRQMEK